MRPESKDTVREVFRSFIDAQGLKLRKRGVVDTRLGYPFHRLFFSEAEVRAARTERSVVTAMGSVLYPQLALAVARDRFEDVHLEFEITGNVNDAAINMIEEIVTILRTGPRQRTVDRRPDHERELREILNSLGGGQSQRSIIADLYIGDFTQGPLFVELKTPMPNLDIAAESKRKLLYYLTIRARQGIDNAQAFLGLTYNPFITRERYGHSVTKQVMDMEKQVLMGGELWNAIGGPGTYDEILELIDEIGPSDTEH